MPLYLVEAPAEPVVTLALLKQQCNVQDDDWDDLITSYGKAITDYIDGGDGSLGRALVSQTWELRFDCFPGCDIRIPLPPLIEVESVKYYDDNDALQTVATSVYEVVGTGGLNPAIVALRYGQVWPDTGHRREAVAIRFRAGYRDTEESPPPRDVPENIKLGIMQWVATVYMQRETVNLGTALNEIPFGAEQLLAPYQVAYFG